MTTTDRRNFVMMTAGAALALIMRTDSLAVQSALSPIMAARIRAMGDALEELEVATDALQGDAVGHARGCVENAFVTPSACAASDDAIMMALDAYEQIHAP